MRLVDSRRLRGPGLDARRPGAIAEAALDPDETPEDARARWADALAALAAAIGRPELATSAQFRAFPGGLALRLTAPIDGLYAATDLAEHALERAEDARRASPDPRAFARSVRQLARAFAREARPALGALEAAARDAGVPFVWDDSLVSLGAGRFAAHHALDALPAAADVDWPALAARARIPIALVTGTNGKTTSTRLVARMARLAGHVPGHTSSDGVAVNEALIEAGDWTGAEAARLVLRHPDVTLAVLETARGGILRRGLAIDAVDAALLTNVSADHLGEYGVFDLDTMARTKAVVGHAVRPSGKVVLCADDPALMRLAPSFAPPEGHAEVVLFGLEPDAPAVRAHLAAGGTAFLRDGAWLVRRGPEGDARLAGVADVPLTFGGAARHNVLNALGAAALGEALGLPRHAIVGALTSFGARPEDNPGRGTLVTYDDGVRALLDFGHNPAGLTELYALARVLAGEGRLLAVTTHAGDRSEDDFAAFARAVVEGGASRAVLWETEKLLRGLAPGVVRARLRASLERSGLAATDIFDAATERDAIARARADAKPGDLLVVAPHLDR